MYEFMNWLDIQHGYVEAVGSLLFGVLLFGVSYLMWWREGKGFMSKWKESAKANFGREITRHEKKSWETK